MLRLEFLKSYRKLKLCGYGVLVLAVLAVLAKCRKWRAVTCGCEQETDREVQMEVDSLMTSDIAMSGLCTEDASTERVRSGLFFAKSDKTVCFADAHSHSHRKSR